MSAIKVEVFLEKEQIKELFENAEVKFSLKKLKELTSNVDHADMEIKERLEELLAEIIEEMITDEWGE
jgi:hypothetical protein